MDAKHLRLLEVPIRRGDERTTMSVGLVFESEPNTKESLKNRVVPRDKVFECIKSQVVLKDSLVDALTQLASTRFDTDPKKPWVVEERAVSLFNAKKVEDHPACRIDLYVNEKTGEVRPLHFSPSRCHIRRLVVPIQREGKQKQFTVFLGMKKRPVADSAEGDDWETPRKKREIVDKLILQECEKIAARRFDAAPDKPWTIPPSLCNVGSSVEEPVSFPTIDLVVDEKSCSVEKYTPYY
jgi:nitrous oxide reductase accessory protein NosL